MLDGCAKSFYNSYQQTCDNCMALGNFSFQCSVTLEESMISHTRVEALEYLVYKSAHDPLEGNI
jgi:hypothetical protein